MCGVLAPGCNDGVRIRVCLCAHKRVCWLAHVALSAPASRYDFGLALRMYASAAGPASRFCLAAVLRIVIYAQVSAAAAARTAAVPSRPELVPRVEENRAWRGARAS